MLCRRLKRYGYECRYYLNAKDALVHIDRLLPDILLLDIMMPEMDGIEMLTLLRQKYNALTLPVLMVTAKSARADVVQAFEADANDYIEKPIDFPVLVARIKTHLSRKRLDDQLSESRQLLEHHNKRLASASQHKTNFLFSMSHELRTPLNSILGYSEVLFDGLAGELNEKQSHYCKSIYDSGTYLLALINDLLDLSKIEEGKLELFQQPTNVEGLVKSVEDIINERAKNKGVIFNIEVESDLGNAVIDALRTKQILINLLSNAVKFTEQGKSVKLHILIEKQKLIFKIQDEGQGIAEEDLERIFLPFEQAHSALESQRINGTGLGLALVKRLVELHGGTVKIHSKVGQGSEFLVYLPYYPSDECYGDLIL